VSYFSGDDIWGSYQNQNLQSPIDWARTPVLINNGMNGLLIGALTSEIFETEISTSNNRFSLYMPIVNGYHAIANNTIPIETIWMQYGSNFTQLFLNYANQVKLFNPPIRSQTVTNFYAEDAGTCDWYNDYGNVNDATVNAEINGAAALVHNGLGYFIMDDGWGSNETCRYYNWSTWDPIKFPNGLGSIIAKAHQDGLKFAVWNRIGFAPIWVQQNHPNWVLSWGSGDNKSPTMNLALPAVQDYMAAVFSNWSAQGIDGIKVDFIMNGIDSGAWNATLWNSNLTRTQQVNLYLNLLDQYASHYNISILLCGTPYGYPS
jgi:alpha-galactosidase